MCLRKTKRESGRDTATAHSQLLRTLKPIFDLYLTKVGYQVAFSQFTKFVIFFHTFTSLNMVFIIAHFHGLCPVYTCSR